jgi:alpha-1,3-glucan synthase
MLVMLLTLLSLLLFGWSPSALRFDPKYVDYNLNTNRDAVDPLNYSGIWEDHIFHKSPDNWRFPFYTLFLDKFVNGDPANDDINGTVFEHDSMYVLPVCPLFILYISYIGIELEVNLPFHRQTQLRHGGDLQGLVDSLDYLQGMGIKGVYIAGSPFINFPWGADSYSPLDLTLLDQHYGNIKEWQNAVTEIHRRDMYIILDNTMSTMGDLLGAKGFLNSSTPFTLQEHDVVYRDPQRQYLDFKFSNAHNDSCEYPRLWFEDGFPVGKDVTDQLQGGCRASEFDQVSASQETRPARYVTNLAMIVWRYRGVRCLS